MTRRKKNPLPAGAEGVTVAALAAELGVAAGVVEVLARRYREGALPVHAEAVLPDALAEKIRATIAEAMAPTPAPGADAAATTPAGASPDAVPAHLRADLRVSRVFPWSNNILALLPNGNEVVCAVRDASRLAPGMVLRSAQQNAYCWVYTGRLPQTTGERHLFFVTTVQADPAAEALTP